jgi:uncharacterized protein
MQSSPRHQYQFDTSQFPFWLYRLSDFGLLAGRIVAIVHTEDDGLIRIISARKASKYEQQIYREQV